MQIALDRGAIDVAAVDPITAAVSSDLVLLSGPVFAIQDWMEKLAPLLQPHQLVTDVGSVKVAIAERARPLFGGPGQAGFLPGHPMAGKEVSGAAHADAQLFTHAVWLFTEFARPSFSRRVARLGGALWLPHHGHPGRSDTMRFVPGSAICLSFSPPL